MFQHRLRAGAAGLTLALVLAGCGGTGDTLGGSTRAAGTSPASIAASPLAGLSAEAVMSRARTALRDAKTVRYRAKVVGDASNPAQATIDFDLRIAKGKGVTGSMALEGGSLTVLQVGKDSYIAADSTFLASKGVPAGDKGTWFRPPAQLRSLIEVADLAKTFDMVDAKGTKSVTLSLGTPKTVDGRNTVAVVVTSRAGDKDGVLYVAADGPARPLLYEETGGTSRTTLSFTEYDQPVEITAPKPESIVEVPSP
jgi:hypothetical protein